MTCAMRVHEQGTEDNFYKDGQLRPEVLVERSKVPIEVPSLHARARAVV